MKKFLLLFLIGFQASCFAIFVENPANTAFFKKSLFLSNEKKPIWNVKGALFYDHIFKENFQDDDPTSTEFSEIKLSTFGGIVSFDLYNRWDIYVLGGVAKLQDDVIFSHSNPAWGVGTSVLLYKTSSFYLTADGKYFMTDQKSDEMRYGDGLATFVDGFKYAYEEFQASLALGYSLKNFVPYIAATYLYSTIKPKKYHVFIQLPDEAAPTLMTSSPSKLHNNWGLAFGCSLYSCEQMSLAFEIRLFDQNGYHLSSMFRF